MKAGLRDGKQRFKCKRDGYRFARPVCKLCGGLTYPTNTTGVCTRTPACKKAHKSISDKNYTTRHPKPGKPSKPKTAKAAHPWEIPDDGITDLVAVDLCVRGVRKVCLSPPEQQESVLRMLRMDFGWKEICDHLGVGSARLTKILNDMGYEAIQDPTQAGAKYSSRKLITRIDRPRGPKMLSDVGPGSQI